MRHNLGCPLEAAKTAERLDEIRYRAGSVALRTWLDAQEARRQAEIARADNRLSRLQNFATLCQVLGGAPDMEGSVDVSPKSARIRGIP
jgi:outer membrane protein TolC